MRSYLAVCSSAGLGTRKAGTVEALMGRCGRKFAVCQHDAVDWKCG